VEGHPISSNRVEHFDFAPVPANDPDIAGLAAATRIEDRSVEEQSIRRDLEDRSLRLG
jgi:hypothetical protein